MVANLFFFFYFLCILSFSLLESLYLFLSPSLSLSLSHSLTISLSLLPSFTREEGLDESLEYLNLACFWLFSSFISMSFLDTKL